MVYFAGFLVSVFLVKSLHADIGIVVADPTGEGSSAYTHAGHALLYLSGVCPASPVRARLCTPGEQGSIITIFPDFHELQPYEWNIVPVSMYVNGTTDPNDRLLIGTKNVKVAITGRARSGYLAPVCGGECPMVHRSYWRDTLAATIERDVFIYAVKTTPEQDAAAVAWLNDQPNVNHYKPITDNCAMFVQRIVNSIFPNAMRRDVLNDFGIMTPKAGARSFSRWAHDRPELGFHAMHFEQRPGTLHRSGTASNGTEAAFHIKKYLIPAFFIGDHEVAGSFFVMYFLTARFNLYNEYAKYPSPQLTGLVAERNVAKKQDETRRVGSLDEEIAASRSGLTGSELEWQNYRARYLAMVERNPKAEKRWLKEQGQHFDSATVTTDGNGQLWMTWPGDPRHVGVYSSTILSSESDPGLAFELLSWRVGYVLEAKKRMRPPMPEFHEDWALFEAAYRRTHDAEVPGERVAAVVAP
ncbi:hypothetical protein [Silvibacterium acidisoli]|uniref:hypothetical protein n=1 Tax=Acidobacteriaceae bacterium ZG23-2 TaxID=2883246 RepID=UPI00406CB8D3